MKKNLEKNELIKVNAGLANLPYIKKAMANKHDIDQLTVEIHNNDIMACYAASYAPSEEYKRIVDEAKNDAKDLFEIAFDNFDKK